MIILCRAFSAALNDNTLTFNIFIYLTIKALLNFNVLIVNCTAVKLIISVNFLLYCIVHLFRDDQFNNSRD